MKVAALVLSLAAVAWAAPQGVYQPPVVAQPQYSNPGPQYSNPGPQYQDTPAQYTFQWDINDQYSGNYYGQQEQREGPNTQGSYYVRLPDTRLLRVEYYVDEYGYHPTITYEGEAQYPSAPAPYSQPAPAPQPTYQQPIQIPSQVYNQPGK